MDSEIAQIQTQLASDIASMPRYQSSVVAQIRADAEKRIAQIKADFERRRETVMRKQQRERVRPVRTVIIRCAEDAGVYESDAQDIRTGTVVGPPRLSFVPRRLPGGMFFLVVPNTVLCASGPIVSSSDAAWKAAVHRACPQGYRRYKRAARASNEARA